MVRDSVCISEVTYISTILSNLGQGVHNIQHTPYTPPTCGGGSGAAAGRLWLEEGLHPLKKATPHQKEQLNGQYSINMGVFLNKAFSPIQLIVRFFSTGHRHAQMGQHSAGCKQPAASCSRHRVNKRLTINAQRSKTNDQQSAINAQR